MALPKSRDCFYIDGAWARSSKVAFTGSTAAGRRIGAICRRDLRRFSLELGGRSAAIALPDADPQTVAAHAIPFGLAFNSGQACAALTRILVPRARSDEFTQVLEAAVVGLTVGDPLDPAIHIGPVIAERQRTGIEGLRQRQRRGRTAGARRPPPARLDASHASQECGAIREQRRSRKVRATVVTQALQSHCGFRAS